MSQSLNELFLAKILYDIQGHNPRTIHQRITGGPKGSYHPTSKHCLKNLPKGFKETMSYGMLGYVVPHEIYPGGYHCDPKLPLPFANIASQKNFIAFYHMGVYAIPGLLKWFTTEYPKHSPARLDMGKSCIRFKKPEHIPYKLIGELIKKVSVKDWIKVYEENVKR